MCEMYIFSRYFNIFLMNEWVLIVNFFFFFINLDNEQYDEPVNDDNSKTSNICLPPGIGVNQNDVVVAGGGDTSRGISVVSSSTDEGGFNEPSPEIKSKLKPVYQFDIQSPPLPPSPPARNIPPPLPPNDTDQESPPDLNYVDVSVSESSSSIIINGRVLNGISESSAKVVYATIKPEIPPPTELLLENEMKDEAKVLDVDEQILRESSFIPMKAEFDPADDESVTELDCYIEKPLPQLPLDLQDVQYADASEPGEETSVSSIDAMTADEAEKLLSSK